MEKLIAHETLSLSHQERVVAQYLKYGSVDEIIRSENPPFSFAEIHRILDRWEIVKNTGRNEAKLSHILCFLAELVHTNYPLETLYKKMPPSFLPSISTIRRVYRYVRDGVTRRVATALVISLEGQEENVLIGTDISTPRLELGKAYGALSLPMTFSRPGNTSKQAVMRVLQQEVFSLSTVKKEFPYQVLPSNPTPFMYINVADVQVGVYQMSIPPKNRLSSFKLKDLHYVSIDELKETPSTAIRSGVRDIIAGYQEYLACEKTAKRPRVFDSQLNLAVMRLSY